MNATTTRWITREETARGRHQALAAHAYAPLILRLSLGILFLAHALAKVFVFTLPGTVQFFEAVGFPGFLAYPVFAVELIAGVLLILGLYTRWAALALVPVALGATAAHWPNGWLFTNGGGGWEFTAFLTAAALALFLLDDDGPLALSRAGRRA